MRKNLLFIIAILAGLVLNSCKKEEDAVSPYEEQTSGFYAWETGTYASANLNETLINQGMTEAQNSNKINGLLVIRGGKIIAERYFRNFNEHSAFDMKSATKSYVSAFAGIAVSKGMIALDTKMTDLLLEPYTSPVDLRMKNITLRHLLTMTSGLTSDENIPNLTYNDNWVNKILSYPLYKNPGEFFMYSDCGVHLLGAMLTKAGNRSLFSLAKSFYFNLLGYELYDWMQDPQGIYVGSASMEMTLRNMAVIGEVYLRKGYLKGKQILPESWINESLTEQVSGFTNWGKMTNRGYGYLWWLGKIGEHRVFSAIGYGGQYVLCIPDLDMIVASACPTDVIETIANEQSVQVVKIIADYFIPAAN